MTKGLERAIRGNSPDVLKRAAEALERADRLLKTKGWSKGAPARDKDGNSVDPFSVKADSFSILGAMRLVSVTDNDMYSAMMQAASLHAQTRAKSPVPLDLWNNGFCQNIMEARDTFHAARDILNKTYNEILQETRDEHKDPTSE